MTVPLPTVAEAINAGGPASVAWRNWFQAINDKFQAGDLTLADLEAAVADLQAQLAGLDSGSVAQGEGIAVYGSLADTLTIALRALGDDGSGTFKLLTRDDYGRLSGTADGNTDDVPEGVTNLYFTDERAQDAVGAAIAAGTGDGATLSYNDAGNAIGVTNTDKGSVAVAAHEAAADPHPQYATAAEAKAAAVADSITNGVTDVAPSQNAVFDALALKFDKAGGQISGDVELTGSGRRLKANLSGTPADRLFIATNVTNGVTNLGLAPDGTAQIAIFAAFNASDVTNASAIQLRADSTSSHINSLATGTGTVYPLGLRISSVEMVRLETTGDWVPATDNARALGTASLRWSAGHIVALNTYGAVTHAGTLSPAQITANQDNYAPTDHATTYRFRLSTDASRNLTGLQGGASGREVVIANVGSFDLVLVHDATSTAANRFLCPNSANLTLNPNDSVRCWYDATSSRWRVIGV